LLRAGGLAAPMYFAEERTIGPSLGADNITKGIDASLWGMLFVSLFIMAIYRAFGLIATIALAGNMVLLLALMSLLGATLTLPGIAGIVLTMGMAVDANVLIFSRIREELANGMSVQRAIHEGFNRAYTAIVDANLTTLLVGGILFAMGTGPVKGFAVTMSLGIFTSMFTAVMVTRAMVNLTCGGRDIKKFWFYKGLNFGLDFTGGTLIELTYERPANLGEVREELVRSGFHDAVVQSFGATTDLLWKFAVGAILSLVHDVIVTMGILSFFQITFDLTVLAAG
uniref:Protein translocase subunit SecD n=1 Tax=Steinernema glaseri TaxID=37863 RepID=A0A1I8AV04_9BILA